MENYLKFLLDYVKKGKKYSAIPDEIVKKEIQNYFKKNPDTKNFLEDIKSTKSEKFKIVVKDIRSQLHKKHASFENKEIQKREEYLKELNFCSKPEEIYKKILNTSISSKERLLYYPELYKKIFQITGKPKIISDFGCGINPLSLPFMDLGDEKNKIEYYAYEISQDDVDFINDYFSIPEIKKRIIGKAQLIDLQKENLKGNKKFPKSDVSFLFKVVDVIEEKGHRISEKVIKNIDSNFIVVSFATKTLSGKPMNHPQRGWIERMLDRLEYKFEIIKFYNEIYYIVDKRKTDKQIQ